MGGYSDRSTKSIVWNKIIKQLVFPYIVFSAMGVCLTVVFPAIYGLEQPYHTQLNKFVEGIIIARGSLDYTGHWGAVWFLISQSCLVFMIYVIEGLDKKSRTLSIVLVLLAQPLNILLKNLLHVTWLPLNVGAALTGLPIFYLGLVCANVLKNRINNSSKAIVTALSLTAIILGGVIGSYNIDIVAFVSNSYGIVWLMYLSSSLILIGIYGVSRVLYLFKIVSAFPFKAVEWIGKNSIIYLGIHGMTIPVVETCLHTQPGDMWFVVAFLTIIIDSIIIIVYKTVKRKMGIVIK